MHEIQSQLMGLAKKYDLSRTTLVQIAQMVGRPSASPTLINHHFAQLEKRGLLFVDRKAKTQRFGNELDDDRFYRIPVVGAASCGNANQIADEMIEGYIQVSKSVFRASEDDLLAVKASGDSMNRASVVNADGTAKTPINDGDYVVVDRSKTEPDNGRYVLSIIGGMANIKRFSHNGDYIALESESTNQEAYPPIIIDDSDEYMVNGTVVGVFDGARS